MKGLRYAARVLLLVAPVQLFFMLLSWSGGLYFGLGTFLLFNLQFAVGSALKRSDERAGNSMHLWNLPFAILVLLPGLLDPDSWSHLLLLVAANGLHLSLLYALFARAVERVHAQPRRITPWICGVTVTLGCLLALSLGEAPSTRHLLNVLPVLAAVLATAAVWYRLRTSTAERALRTLYSDSRYDLELLDQELPIRLRYTRPAQPQGLRRAKEGEEPMPHLLLSALVPLHSPTPQAALHTLRGNEDTLLSLLHAWPHARIEPDAVVWEATPEQLTARGPDLSATLDAAVVDTEALAELLS